MNISKENSTGTAGVAPLSTSDGTAVMDSSYGSSFNNTAIIPSLIDLLPYIVAAAILSVIAEPMLTWWYWEYTRPESYYAHAPLIPLMAGFMLWSQREKLRLVVKKPFLPALAVLIPTVALLIIAIKGDMRSVQSLTFLVVIWASILLALGTQFFKAAWFPILFLILMSPLPAPLLNDSTLHLQMWSTELASKILSVTGFGNTQIGNTIHIDDFTFDVDLPCSGFKTLLALTTFNAFLAFMLDGPVYRRVLLFIICSPLALLVNGFRIALIGIVGECTTTQTARVFHDYSGIITLILGFVVLFSIAKALGCRKFAGWDIF